MMGSPTTVVTIGLALAGLLYLGGAATAWHGRDEPAADLFAAVAWAAGIGTLLIGTSFLFAPDTMLAVSVAVVALILPVPWLLFVFAYTGRDEFVTPGIAAIVGTVPTLGLAATAVLVGSKLVPWLAVPPVGYASGLMAIVVAILVLVKWTALVYAGGLALIGSGLLLWTFERYEHLNWTLGVLLGIVGTIPWLSLLFGLQIAESEPLALSALVTPGLLVGGVAALSVLGNYRLFRTIPAAGNIGPATVIEELDDMVIVTDSEGAVLEINGATQERLDLTQTAVTGADVSEVLGEPLSEVRDADTLELLSGAGRRLFEPTISELTGPDGHTLGWAITLRDVTDRTARQQRLTVFNRVLRHNLRNDMTAILGHAEFLTEGVTDDELAASAETIVQKSEDLTALSEKVRNVERLVAASGTARREVRLADLTRRALRDVAAEYPRATFEHDVPATVDVETVPPLLERALANLLENAVEHNESERPWVELRATYDPGRAYPLTVSVADDGPGIPESDRSAVLDGEETPLQHGRGLGLWEVRWAATRLGGDLDIGRRDSCGSVVSLRLPHARRTSEPDATSAGAGRGESDSAATSPDADRREASASSRG